MSKLDELKKAHLQARKNGDETGKSLYSSMVSMCDHNLKEKPEADEDQVVEDVAVTMKKNIEETRETVKDHGDKELELLQSFLPKELSEEEVREIIKDEMFAMEEPKFGPLMSSVMKRVGKSADGKFVKSLVGEELNNG